MEVLEDYLSKINSPSPCDFYIHTIIKIELCQMFIFYKNNDYGWCGKLYSKMIPGILEAAATLIIVKGLYN